MLNSLILIIFIYKYIFLKLANPYIFVKRLFKELFVFTDAGLCLYSWKSEEISESTDSSLISGLLFAISEFAKQAFRGRLQRLDLDNSKLIMTSQEFEVAVPRKNSTYEKKTLIFGALVDSRDNNHLIQDILIKIGQDVISDFDYSGMKLMDKNIIDPKINSLLKSKTYSRNTSFMVMGIIISALGILIGSASNSLNWQYFAPSSLIGFLDIVPVLVTSFGIIFIGAMLIGEKNKAIKLVVIINTLFGLFLFDVWEFIINQSKYFSSFGSIYTYIIFVILISFTSALFGSLLTERKYLFI